MRKILLNTYFGNKGKREGEFEQIESIKDIKSFVRAETTKEIKIG